MPRHAHHHHLLHLHSPSFTPGRLFWSILKSAMSSALNVFLGFLKVIVWQTDGGFRQINKSRSMASVMCRSDWFLSPTEVSVRPSLCSHSRWILWAHTHTQTLKKSWAVCVSYGWQGGTCHTRTRSHSGTQRSACTRANKRNTPTEPAEASELTKFIVKKNVGI